MKYPGFAQRLRQACLESGLALKQKELGKAFGVSGTMVWNYLHGEKLPGMTNARVIAMKLGVCVEWLLTGRGPQRPGDMPEGCLDISPLSPDAQEALRTMARLLRERDGSTHPE